MMIFTFTYVWIHTSVCVFHKAKCPWQSTFWWFKERERFGQSSPVPSLCPCHRSILYFMAYRHAETDWPGKWGGWNIGSFGLARSCKTNEKRVADFWECFRWCIGWNTDPNLDDRWFVNKKSLSMGASTHVIRDIDFSQLKPHPSLHKWQQRHWCSAWNQTAASCRLQDATISIHIWHVNTVTDIWFCAETAQVSKRCCCRSSCQLDEKLQFCNMLVLNRSCAFPHSSDSKFVGWCACPPDFTLANIHVLW